MYFSIICLHFSMLSLLKLPASIGSTGKEVPSKSEHSWYLREMFPNLSSDVINKVIKSSATIDEAERVLTAKACCKGW